MNRIGTQHGFIKRTGNLQLATLSLFTVDQVKNTIEITLCETVAALLGKQGYLNCLCKKKIVIQTVAHV